MEAFKEFLSSLKKGQCRRKYWLDSILEPQSHIALIVFLKLCRNLCSFKWLKAKRSLVSKFMPIGSCIEKTKLFTLMKLNSIFLSLPKDSAFLILLSNLFCSLIHYGKNECLKLSVWMPMFLKFHFVMIWCYKLDLYRYYTDKY